MNKNNIHAKIFTILAILLTIATYVVVKVNESALSSAAPQSQFLGH